jgi:hypothetical protein
MKRFSLLCLFFAIALLGSACITESGPEDDESSTQSARVDGLVEATPEQQGTGEPALDPQGGDNAAGETDRPEPDPWHDSANTDRPEPDPWNPSKPGSDPAARPEPDPWHNPANSDDKTTISSIKTVQSTKSKLSPTQNRPFEEKTRESFCSSGFSFPYRSLTEPSHALTMFVNG